MTDSFRMPGMDAVKADRNFVYSMADGEPLRMDVYSLPRLRRPRPAVILVHGGPIPRIGAKNMGQYHALIRVPVLTGWFAGSIGRSQQPPSFTSFSYFHVELGSAKPGS
jgi:hypothetical protein